MSELLDIMLRSPTENRADDNGHEAFQLQETNSY